MPTKRVYEIAEKFEAQVKASNRSEDNLEDVKINLPAEDIYYMLQILLSPELITATHSQKPEDLVWGEAEVRWPTQRTANQTEADNIHMRAYLKKEKK